MGDVRNTQLGLSMGGVLFTGEPGFGELLQKAIVLPLKIFRILKCFLLHFLTLLILLIAAGVLT